MAWRWNPLQRRLGKRRTKTPDVYNCGEKAVLDAVNADSLERKDAHLRSETDNRQAYLYLKKRYTEWLTQDMPNLFSDFIGFGGRQVDGACENIRSGFTFL